MLVYIKVQDMQQRDGPSQRLSHLRTHLGAAQLVVAYRDRLVHQHTQQVLS